MTAFDATDDLWTPGERAFAGMLARRAGGELGDTLAWIGALVLRRRAEGSARVEVEAEAGRPFPAEAPRVTTPDAAVWRAALEHPDAARLVAREGGVAPLVYDGEHVALHRDVHAEETVAQAVVARLAVHDVPESLPWQAVLGAPAGSAPEGQGDLFAEAVGVPDDQAVAAASALRHRVAVVTGGPGTGKTTTVAKILSLWCAANPTGRLALAAPTGKAAARLSSSIAAAADLVPLPTERIPRATTLHTLLAYNPGRDRFGADERRPLIVDLVVVDEASMIDTAMMAALVRALPEDASLILLGDADQLASVESGSVLADLVAAAAGVEGEVLDRDRLAEKSEGFAGWCAPRLGGRPAVDARGAASALRDAVTCLRQVHRNADATFAEFVEAVRLGDADAARRATSLPEAAVSLRAPEASLDGLLAEWLPRWRARVEAASPAAALAAARDFQWLCVVREDVARVGEAVDTALSPTGEAGTFFDGRPVIVTRNDRATRLANGDVGVCWTDAEGRRRVWFDDDDGGPPRGVPLARMPEHEAAWALTVHKSQGSEYRDVVVLLPADDHPLVTRELVYTGVTRAKRRAAVIARPSVFDAGLARRVRRSTGLAQRLFDRA